MAVTIDDTKCNGISACSESGQCMLNCPTGAIEDKEDKPSVKYFSCVDCGKCIPGCPNEAITAARRS